MSTFSRTEEPGAPPSPVHNGDMRLDAGVQQQLLAVAHRRTLARGESLFLKGSSPDALFGVVAGSLRVSVVAAADFHRLVAAQPEVHMAFTRLVCLRLRQALAWIDDVILMPLPVRLAHRLLALDAREGAGEGPAMLGVSQEDLSFMLGVSRQSVNRQLKLWEEDGTLRVRYRGIELLDRARLERHAATPP